MNRQDDIKKAVEVMKNGGVILYPIQTELILMSVHCVNNYLLRI